MREELFSRRRRRGKGRRKKEEKEAAGNLEHLLHPSVTNVKMVPRLKKELNTHKRERVIGFVRRGQLEEGKLEEVGKKATRKR